MDHRRMSAEDYLKSAVTRAEHRVKYCRSELQRFTQHALDRARDRLIYCRKQRIAYEAYANDTEQSQRTLRKLGEDEKRAQLDCSWAEHRLSEILATDEATTAFKAKVAGLDL
jgi:hypothetical protein